MPDCLSRFLPLVTRLWLLIWQGLVGSLCGVGFVVSPRVRQEWAKRRISPTQLRELRSERQQFQRCALFFCASAGEFEQALPVIDRMRQSGQWFVHVVFASQSGPRYVEAAQLQTSWQLAPPDLRYQWRLLFSVLRPEVCLVVRHDFWPAFLAEAWRKSKLVLIDASLSNKAVLYKYFMRRVLRWFDHIFVVDGDELSFFEQAANQQARVTLTGDSKFDRAFERARKKQDAVAALREEVSEHFGYRRRLIVGSAWPEDAKLALTAYQMLPEQEQSNWQLVLVPHDVSPEMSMRLSQMVKDKNLIPVLASTIKKAGAEPHLADRSVFAPPRIEARAPVFIIDQMGQLAEWYGCADLAMVGGAMHHQVHNVVEPISHGVPVVIGPRFHSQREARLFVARGLVNVVTCARELCSWWLSHADSAKKQTENRDIARMLCGASDKIMAGLEPHA